MTKVSDDNMEISDAISALLVAHDDLGDSYNEQLNNIKEGVEYFPPVDKKEVGGM